MWGHLDGLNKLCVVCGRELGPHATTHCTDRSLVAVEHKGLFKKRVAWFSLTDGRPLAREDLSTLKATETLRAKASTGPRVVDRSWWEGLKDLVRLKGSTPPPPTDWTDKDGWNRFFDAQLRTGQISSYPPSAILRFLSLAKDKGGRIWFPGCGLDAYPITYAARGCHVFATDLSWVAVKYQKRVAATFAKENRSADTPGTFIVAEHDFTQGPPSQQFDVVINCRAFQGLSGSAMHAAAANFYAALRPGGAAIIDTMNVQGDARNWIEDSLSAAGFYVPFQRSDRWYRQQLDGTGILYGMLLGRPRIPYRNQYPPNEFAECARRDQEILDSFSNEYVRRRQDEAAQVEAMMSNPTTVVAHVVYSTG